MNKNYDITSKSLKDQNNFEKVIHEKKRLIDSLPIVNPIKRLKRINIFKGLKKYSVREIMEDANKFDEENQQHIEDPDPFCNEKKEYEGILEKLEEKENKEELDN